MTEKNETGCWGCKYIDWFESDFESSDESGYMCNNRDDVDKFKTFPCNRKLKCFVARDKIAKFECQCCGTFLFAEQTNGESIYPKRCACGRTYGFKRLEGSSH